MQPFIIPVKGLKAGSSEFHWHAGGEFFGSFGNPDILDADLAVEVSVVCDGPGIEASCRIEGTVTVPCDRCLAPLVLPVSVSFETEDTYDLNQDIYDEVCLSLPIIRVHPEGGCDEDTLKYLSK